ncbi:MAG TPA: hypothetical protein GXZ48_02130 [Acholeplasmataceae bacterium]|nr:hypothetical protein [Acholeplasmataceae bacterium]
MKDILLKFLGYLSITTAIYGIYIVLFQTKKTTLRKAEQGETPNPKRPQVFNKIWFKIVAIILSIILFILGWVLLS